MRILIRRKIDNCGRITLPRQAMRNLDVDNGAELIVEYQNNKFTLSKDNTRKDKNNNNENQKN